ncbi:MAG: response regulator [Nitrospinae bacterium]|nr:response regulator [Nitrospinota bacterium]
MIGDKAATKEKTKEKTGFNPKILVLEDGKIAAMALQSELASIAGASVSIVSAADRVLEDAAENPPDVIILRFDPHGMNGPEICKRLKKKPATRDIPVIFIAENDNRESQKEAFESGAADYVVTPFPRGRLAEKTKKLLGKGAAEEGDVRPQTILVAEDSDTVRKLVAGILKKQGHEVVEAADGLIAWSILQRRRDVDLIISDVNMPNMNGHQLCRMVRGMEEHAFVPFIVVSSIADKDDITKILNSGADDYLIKPFATEEFLARLKAHLRVRRLYNDLNAANSRLQAFNASLEKMVVLRTREISEANLEAIMMLAVASEHRDTDTGNHVRRISEHATRLALAMNFPEARAEAIGHSSILHDVGKIAITDVILKKEGKLDEREFNVMKTHSAAGEAILSKAPFFKTAREIARSHHEKFDGTGYPDGLREFNIPLSARITAVADVFDALTSRRVYKAAWSINDAYAYVAEQAGKHFDPLVVEAFDKIYKEGFTAKMMEKYK